MSALDRMSDEFVICRSYGHRWESKTVTRVVDQYRRPIQYRVGLECDRCEATRTQVLDRFGGVVGNRYSYAEGYAKTPDEDRIWRSDARNEFLDRTIHILQDEEVRTKSNQYAPAREERP